MARGGRVDQRDSGVSDWGLETFPEPDPVEAEARLLRASRFLRTVPRLALRIAVENSWISLTLAVSASMIVALAVVVILPGYTSPMSRLYTSKFGYGDRKSVV